jgi:hypothetical protein
MAPRTEKKSEGVPCGQLVMTAAMITVTIIAALLLALYIANQLHLI